MAVKKALVKHIQGVTFMGKSDSNHWVVMDGPEEFGGNNAGIRPKELILLALAGCTGSDVAVILQKKKVQLDGFEMNLSAEVHETHPQVFTKIHLEYVFYGKNIQAETVERAIANCLKINLTIHSRNIGRCLKNKSNHAKVKYC